MHFRKCVSFTTLAFAVTAAHAQDRTYLNKSKIECAVAGKKLTFNRASDSSPIELDIRSNGALYGTNLTNGRRNTASWNMEGDVLKGAAGRDSSSPVTDTFNTVK